MLAVFPRGDAHHVEVIRVDHGHWRSGVKEILVFVIVVVDCTTWHPWWRSTPRSWWRSHRRTSSHSHFLFPQGELSLPHLQLALSQSDIWLVERRGPTTFRNIIIDDQMAEFLQISAVQGVSFNWLPRDTVGWPVHRWSAITVNGAGVG